MSTVPWRRSSLVSQRWCHGCIDSRTHTNSTEYLSYLATVLPVATLTERAQQREVTRQDAGLSQSRRVPGGDSGRYREPVSTPRCRHWCRRREAPLLEPVRPWHLMTRTVPASEASPPCVDQVRSQGVLRRPPDSGPGSVPSQRRVRRRAPSIGQRGSCAPLGVHDAQRATRRIRPLRFLGSARRFVQGGSRHLF